MSAQILLNWVDDMMWRDFWAPDFFMIFGGYKLMCGIILWSSSMWSNLYAIDVIFVQKNELESVKKLETFVQCYWLLAIDKAAILLGH